MLATPKAEATSPAATSRTSSTASAGDIDAPGTSASDAIRRNLAEMESSFFDSPTARKSMLPSSSSLLETPLLPTNAAKNTPSTGKSFEGRFSGLGVTPIAARTKTLALKEQENVVDKYQKENFSLKMKLYYLEKRLTQLNDEEVKRMIAENIELSTYKISAAKEIKALNKRVRELQFDVNDRDVRLEAQERASQRETDLASEYDGIKYDTEQELSFMRDRITTYEVEIAQLRDQVHGTAHGGSPSPSVRRRSGSGSVISLRRHEAEVEALELANGHLRDTMSELKMENQELTRHVETLNEDLAKLYDHVNASADGSILDRSASRARARGESGSSGQGYDAREAEIDALELANGQLRDAQSVLRMQNIEINGQLDLLTEDIARFQGIENDHAQLQQAYAALLKEAERLQEEVDRLHTAEDQLDELQSHNDALQREYEDLRKDKQSNLEYAKILTARIDSLTTELTDFADMKQQFEDLQQTHVELQEHLENTIHTLKKNEQVQVEKTRKTANEKMGNLEDMISKKEAELAVLRSENAGLNQHEGEMYTRMDELVDELEASKKEMGSLRTESERLKSERERLSGLLEREKTARRAQNAVHEQVLRQRPDQQEMQVMNVRNSKIAELEAGRQADRKKMDALERQFTARLQELEKRLVQEREGRLNDRKGARTRLLECERDNNDLKEKLRKLEGRFG